MERRLLDALVQLTPLESAQGVALRALTLHMLEGHAPAAFARLEARPLLEQALTRAGQVPVEIPPQLAAESAMARVDCWYVRRLRGLEHPVVDGKAFRTYLERLVKRGEAVQAWLLGELAAAAGLDVRLPFGDRTFASDRLLHLYWLTHRVLLETEYLRQPMDPRRSGPVREELEEAAEWLVDEERVDLGGEVAFCLRHLGAAGTPAHQALVKLVLGAVSEDGGVIDPSVPDGDAQAPHATAVALLVAAGSSAAG